MSDNIAIFKYAVQPGSQLAMHILRKKTFQKVVDLWCEVATDDEPLWFADRERVTFRELKVGQKWNEKLFGCGLMHFTGRVPESAKGKHVVLLIDVGGEACVLTKEGKIVAGITDVAPIEKNFHILRGKKLIEVSPCAQGGEEIDIWLETGDNDLGIAGHGTLRQAEIALWREDVGSLFYDVQNLALTKPYFPFYTKKHISINRSLFRSYHAVLSTSEKTVRRASKILSAERRKGTPSIYTVYAVGHGHLDLAFMWPIRETKRKEVRTFINQLNNMERYPEYVYGASQPQQFEWMETISPDLFTRLQEAEKRGNLELQGGFWVETDTNIPSGESLIRQAFYGQKYWQEKFGHRVRMCWLPDTFGFSGNLPQILKKSGMDYFLTIKLSWGDTNKFNKHSFRWVGIDGSEVIAHCPPEHTYSGEAMPINTFPAQKEYTERDKIPFWGSLFGMGDGGAGPSVGHIESFLRQRDSVVLPKVVFSPMEKMFERLEKYKSVMEKAEGELYLEAHRGTYTTQSDIKRHNALTEYALHNTEFLAVLTGQFDKEKVDKIWKEFLLYQFHDILPGTSVERVYKECFARHEEMRKELLTMCEQAIGRLKGESLVAYNFNPFGLKTIIPFEGKLYRTELLPYGGSEMKLAEVAPTLNGDESYLTNGILTVRIAKNGDITSVVKEGKEYVDDYFGRIMLHTDITQKFDAWEVSRSYLTSESKPVVFTDAEVTFGCGYVVHQMKGKLSASAFTRRIILRADSPIVEVEVDVDWKEEHKMLRVENHPNKWAEEATCHIQMGNVMRKTHENDSYEKARFEICAQQWVDIGGVSFFGKAKYGWRVKNKVVSLNLLRAPTGPDPTCDRREHTLRFAYYPHGKSPFEAETPKYAYLYNNPPVVRNGSAVVASFASCSERNVIIETIKPSDDGKGIILRLYEGEGKKAVTSLLLSKKPTKVTETNLLEDYIGEVDINKLAFTPYEIKTLKIEYQ